MRLHLKLLSEIIGGDFGFLLWVVGWKWLGFGDGDGQNASSIQTHRYGMGQNAGTHQDGADLGFLRRTVKTLVRHSPCFVVCFPKATKRLEFSILRTCRFVLRTYTKLLVTRDTFWDFLVVDSIVTDFDPNNNRLALLRKLQICCVILESLWIRSLSITTGPLIW